MSFWETLIFHFYDWAEECFSNFSKEKLLIFLFTWRHLKYENEKLESSHLKMCLSAVSGRFPNIQSLLTHPKPTPPGEGLWDLTEAPASGKDTYEAHVSRLQWLVHKLA